MKEFKFGLIFCTVNKLATKTSPTSMDILHFIGYEQPPSEEEMNRVTQEVFNDPLMLCKAKLDSLGITPDDIFILHAPQEILDFYNNENLI